MKLLITGGAGFIGSHFLDFLTATATIENQIENITIIDNLTYASNEKHLKILTRNPRVKFLELDISDRNKFSTINGSYDFLVNFAAESHVDRSLKNPQVFVQTNVLGTCNLLDFVLEGRVKAFIQISTDEVYGSIENGSWSEECDLKPRSPYSASKASADLLALSYFTSFGLDVRITRASNNFGPRQHSEKMIPTIINSIVNNRPIPVYGSGHQIRDWLFVQDHVQGIWRVMRYGKKGQIYNLGGGTELTNLELIQNISEFFPNREISLNHIEDRKGHDFRYSLDFSKASNDLGYFPEVSWADGIVKTIEYYQGRSR